MTSFTELIASIRPSHVDVFVDPPSRLKAFLVLDNLTLGPAAGGIRTASYSSDEEALKDALHLARAMTLKCAIAGLDAGGGKLVIMDHPSLDRKAAFQYIGKRVEELSGLFHTAGDLGTTHDDLLQMKKYCRFVHLDHGPLSEAVGATIVATISACITLGHLPQFSKLKVAVQGCGDMGQSAVRALVNAGAQVSLCDTIGNRAEQCASATGATVISPESFFAQPVDVLVPCARSHVLDEKAVRSIQAKVISGAANNLLQSPRIDALLRERGIIFIPDFLSSSGAVIQGVAPLLMGVEDPSTLIARVEETTRQVLEGSVQNGKAISTVWVAERIAQNRLS